MPKVDDVGYSESTVEKIAHLEKILGMHLAVTQAVLNKHLNYPHLYRYVDLTAGKGFSPDGKLKGSPITFLEQAEADNIYLPYRADFIERNPKNIAELEKNVAEVVARNGWADRKLFYHNGDYRKKIQELFPDVNPNEFGLTFVDPSGELPDFETLHDIAVKRPKMEILIYLASTNVKRQHQYTQRDLEDYINGVGKAYWLCGRPAIHDHFKWIFMLGTSTDVFKNYKRIGFYRLDSEEGQDLFLKVKLTKEEHKEFIQPPLL